MTPRNTPTQRPSSALDLLGRAESERAAVETTSSAPESATEVVQEETTSALQNLRNSLNAIIGTGIGASLTTISNRINSIFTSLNNTVSRFFTKILGGSVENTGNLGGLTADPNTPVDPNTPADQRILIQLNSLNASLTNMREIPPVNTIPLFTNYRDIPVNTWCRMTKNGKTKVYYCDPNAQFPDRVLVSAEIVNHLLTQGYNPESGQKMSDFIRSKLVTVPFPSTFTGCVNDQLRVSPFIANNLNNAFREMENRGITYQINKGTGCMCWRGPRGMGQEDRPGYVPKVSNHALAMAVDFNPQDNPYRAGAPNNFPPGFVEIMKRNGFEWGGDWSRSQDTMHFEIDHDNFMPELNLE